LHRCIPTVAKAITNIYSHSYSSKIYFPI